MAKKPGLLAWYKNGLRSETFAGVVLIIGAVLALVWANSPIRESYFTLSETHIGPEALHINLSLNHWASDGLLAIFFFVVGVELKYEFVAGSLRDIRQALVPVLAAVCGMIGPILVYCVVQLITGSDIFDGWAIPVATDIAFALGVLGVFGKGLPPAVRTFLMTLAVVDDLLGIIVIAIFFSSGINFLYLLFALVTIAIFGFFVQKRIIKWWLLWPLGILAWYFMHGSGVHATIAGVALGMTVPALMRNSEHEPLTEFFSDKLSFWSSGVILPIFSFFAAGVNIVDSGGIGQMLADPVAMGIYFGLPFGKMLGIFGGVFIMIKVLRLRLGESVYLPDIFAVSLVAGIGFTLSFLIATLSFPAADPHEAHARVAVILGSLIAAVLGGIALRLRAKQRLAHIAEEFRLEGSDPDEFPPLDGFKA